MSGKLRPWWNAQRERAAALVAEGSLTLAEIARETGVTERQLRRWRDLPEFAARVQALVQAVEQALRAEGLSNKRNRVAALQDRWDRLNRVIEARAQAHRDVPGGDTGLLVRTVKLVKVYSGGMDDVEEGDSLVATPASQVVEEYQLDTGLLRELRAHEEQAARELGQWTEKTEYSGEQLVREYIGVRVEQV